MADIPIFKSKWQLQKDETFKVRFCLEEIEGKRIKIHLTEKGPDVIEHWVEFKMWDYNAMINLRKRATKYDEKSGTFYVDTDFFNDLKIQYLLKDWSFGQIEPHMKLTHFKNSLSDESFQMFKSFYPWISSAIVSKMNEVLEGYEEE